MGRRKKSVSHYEKSVTRLSALKSIDTLMDFGNGLTIASYELAINDLQGKLNDYNTQLSMVDEKLNVVKSAELVLKDMSERMLTGVATRFGKNSNEYEKAGGVRKSERKKRVAKPIVK